MRIGVLSDTHLRTPGSVLDHILGDLLGDADVILHAGDIVTRRVLEHLEERSVKAVCGNMDDHEVASAVPQTRIMELGGVRVALIHGWGSKSGLAERVQARLASEKPDLIVFGHSHEPFWGEVAGIRMFNPGSAAQNRYTGDATVGIIEIDNGSIAGMVLTVQR